MAGFAAFRRTAAAAAEAVPTRSGPEGSSRNEFRSGRRPASHLQRAAAARDTRGPATTARRTSDRKAPDDRRTPCRIGRRNLAKDASAEGAADEFLSRPIRLSGAGAQIPATDLRRSDRPGRLVRTLTNAFKTGRIAQAFMLTGVRGVGKTTDGAHDRARAELHRRRRTRAGRPSNPAAPASTAIAIAEDRHVDVGDGRRQPHRRRRHPRADRGRALSPRARATRSTSSTKCTCCRRTPSTRC